MASSILNICFHGVGTPRRELEPGEDRFWISVDQFHAILDEVRDWPSLRLSFDDGNASNVEYGLPALVERGLTADFYVLGGRLDQPGSVDSAGVRELARQGMTVGSHGMWHRSWRHMDAAQTEEEFGAARDRIAEAAGSPIDQVACPLGLYDRRVLGELRKRRYIRVYTSDRRVARSDAWLQPRFSVRRDDTPETVRSAARAKPAPHQRARAAAVGLVKRWR